MGYLLVFDFSSDLSSFGAVEQLLRLFTMVLIMVSFCGLNRYKLSDSYLLTNALYLHSDQVSR